MRLLRPLKPVPGRKGFGVGAWVRDRLTGFRGQITGPPNWLGSQWVQTAVAADGSRMSIEVNRWEVWEPC